MAKTIKFDDKTEELLKELDKSMRSIRSRAQVFKKNNPKFLTHAKNPYRDIIKYDKKTGKLTFDFNLTQVRKELKNVHPSARQDVLEARINFYRGKTESKFSRYSDMKGKFGEKVHKSVKDFMDNLDEEQQKKIRNYYKNYNYEDDFSISDFIELAEKSAESIDTLIDRHLTKDKKIW